MKSFFKRILRLVDLELRTFSIEKSENARFFSMLSHHKVNTILEMKKPLGYEMVSSFNHKEYKDKLIAVLNQS